MHGITYNQYREWLDEVEAACESLGFDLGQSDRDLLSDYRAGYTPMDAAQCAMDDTHASR